MRTLIVGGGEIGKSLLSVFDKAYECCILDKGDEAELEYEIMHVCFPYSDKFIDYVNEYKVKYKPKYVVIHSTVPVGTSKKLNAIHSPCIGIHPHLGESLKTFTKFLGGEDASNVAQYFRRAGIKVYLTDKSESTELMKICSTSFYGLCIEWNKEVKRFCDKNNIPFELWTLWTNNYNSGYQKLGYPEYTRPNLVPMMNGQGGHCTQSNAVILHKTGNSKLIEGVLMGGVASNDKLNDSVWLYCEYVGKKRSSGDIAKELGVSDVTILNRFKSFGIPTRDRRWTENELKKIISLSEDKNIKEILNLKFLDSKFASLIK